MSDLFTPTTEQVRDGYRFDPEAEYRDPISAGHLAIVNGYAFDRWLDGVKREAAADALDEAAAALVVDRVEGSTYAAGLPLATAEWASAHTERWLRARAASYRAETTS